MGIEALTHTDSGKEIIPASRQDWKDWVTASSTRSYALNDPLLDWLNVYGNDNGFRRDNELENYDPRTDFTQFIFRKGSEFENAVVEHIGTILPVCSIATDYRRSRSLEAAVETFDAMCRGESVIAQGVLWDAENRTYGLADLLVRSDLFIDLFPGNITEDESRIPAPDIKNSSWHYRVIDIKYSTLSFNSDGTLSDSSGSSWAYKLQVYLYNRMLGRLQGYQPEEAFLLGRGWKQTVSRENFRGNSCMGRLGGVPMSYVSKLKGSLSSQTDEAVNWIRRVRVEGANWQVLPEPSIPEIRPNMKFAEDYPWHNAKKTIASELDDLTLLWNVGLKQRDHANQSGVFRWTDTQCSSSTLGVTGSKKPRVLDSILSINRPDNNQVVAPAIINDSDVMWRNESPVEFFVDFETVSDLDDNFDQIPEKGGQPLIFMIGCGHMEQGEWEWSVFSVDELSESSEADIIEAWFDHMEEVRNRLSPDVAEPLVFHWSSAEISTLKTASNSAMERHPDREWTDPNWYDFLGKVIRNEPVVINGALEFGLKSVAQALHSHGLIDTKWDLSVTDGLGAMVGAWWAADEAASNGCSMKDIELFSGIERYNEIDCKVMMEIVAYLRKYH